jgi:8-oxo-dGTP pyrophosphatase MutT (NUDIX family)
MEIVARGFVFDEEDRILLVKHAVDQRWVLPGGHLEDEDNGEIHLCLQREIKEELGLDVTILGAECMVTDHHFAPLPLPISIHKLQYEHRKRGKIVRLEYRFLARVFGDAEDVVDDEIYDYQWLSPEEVMQLDPLSEVHKSLQEVLEQNIVLLELV